MILKDSRGLALTNSLLFGFSVIGVIRVINYIITLVTIIGLLYIGFKV